MKPFFLLSLCACLIVSCSRFDEQFMKTPGYVTQNDYSFSEGMTVLGKRIEIPYSIENLNRAYNSLDAETKSQINLEQITPTHYYIKFSPKNVEELDILRNIKPRLILSEEPLDYEIQEGGTYYHDPSLPEDVPTFQYSTISVERWRELSDTLSVNSEILISAYIPDYDDDLTKSLPNGINVSAYLALLKEAYKITGIPYEDISTKGAEWHPQGTIKAFDDITGTMVPVPGVRVRGTHLLKTHEDLTDETGYYWLRSFKNPVNMKIIWESNDWDIRNGSIGQATYSGPKIKSGRWDLNADASYSKTIRYAAIQRAAYRHYYGNNCGLARPNNSRKEKIGYFHEDIGPNGDYCDQWGMTIWTDIRIAGKNKWGWRDPSEIFSTTCHELGHAVHYINSTNNYNHSELRLIESWARFVQYLLTIQEYRELGVESSLYYYPYSSYPTMFQPDDSYNFQYRPNNNSDSDYYNTYTPCLIDLYDDYNQLDWPDYHNNQWYHPNDVISGVPPTVIQDITFSSRSFDDVFRKLYWDNTYPTSFYIAHNINDASIVSFDIFYHNNK